MWEVILVLSPYYMLGSVLRAVAAAGNKKGRVCPCGVDGLPMGTDCLSGPYTDAVMGNKCRVLGRKEQMV